MNKIFVSCLIPVLIMLSSITDVLAESRKKEEHVAAVQERIFFKYHELDANIGYISDDDFHHLFPVGIGYTFNFNDLWAWNVLDSLMMVGFEKDLKKDLEEDFGVTPSNFNQLKYAFHSNLMYKPLYGKSAFGKNKVINHEIYFLLGGGAVVYEKKYSWGESDYEVAPSMSIGLGSKIFVNEKICLNAEMKDWVNFRTDDVENNFWVGLSLGYRFNLRSRPSEHDATYEKLDQYMD